MSDTTGKKNSQNGWTVHENGWVLPEPEEPAEAASGKVKVATVWLDGCAGCHMSFLDIDEKIIGLADLIQIVYSPLVDIKKFPEGVDVTLVEGAVSSDEDEEKIHEIRKGSKLLISFGDCAVTANVPAMRNQFKVDEVLKRAYVENATFNQEIPRFGVPRLLKKSPAGARDCECGSVPAGMPASVGRDLFRVGRAPGRTNSRHQRKDPVRSIT